jgi:hypothetical protein
MNVRVGQSEQTGGVAARLVLFIDKPDCNRQ